MAPFGLDDPDDDDDGYGFDLSPLLNLPPDAKEQVRRMAQAMRTPLRPGDPLRHHHIPQFFLRRFADGDRIARVPLESPKAHQIAVVNDVAVVKHLYTTIDHDVGETAAVERMLAVIDGDAVKPIVRSAR